MNCARVLGGGGKREKRVWRGVRGVLHRRSPSFKRGRGSLKCCSLSCQFAAGDGRGGQLLRFERVPSSVRDVEELSAHLKTCVFQLFTLNSNPNSDGILKFSILISYSYTSIFFRRFLHN